MTKELIEHVARTSLPWRDERMTECGLTADNHPTLTRDEFVAKVKEQGQQRASMSTCMTCWSTAVRYWQRGPRSGDLLLAVERAVQRAMYKEDDPLHAELSAIVALVEAHREEFDGFIAGLAETGDIATRRAAKRRAAR